MSISEELESALSSYRRDLEVQPSLAALMQAALKEYLQKRGYGTPLSASPTMYDDAPSIGEGKTASDMVSEDRR